MVSWLVTCMVDFLFACSLAHLLARSLACLLAFFGVLCFLILIWFAWLTCAAWAVEHQQLNQTTAYGVVLLSFCCTTYLLWFGFSWLGLWFSLVYLLVLLWFVWLSCAARAVEHQKLNQATPYGVVWLSFGCSTYLLWFGLNWLGLWFSLVCLFVLLWFGLAALVACLDFICFAVLGLLALLCYATICEPHFFLFFIGIFWACFFGEKMHLPPQKLSNCLDFKQFWITL